MEVWIPERRAALSGCTIRDGQEATRWRAGASSVFLQLSSVFLWGILSENCIIRSVI